MFISIILIGCDGIGGPAPDRSVLVPPKLSLYHRADAYI
ncbi:MAG: hypothetical protein JWQ98_1028 [Chlorobi bacterium]|nr:hypothetical protein [Chlorobiota bacterium]